MIYIGSDHAGYELKGSLISFLEKEGFDVNDMGSCSLDPNDDYPDFIIPLAEKVVDEKGSLGIVIGGSGQGEAIAANKVKGVRAALWYGGDMDIVRLSREHNDSNVLSLGARFVSLDDAKEAVKLWLDTSFSGDTRHERRLNKIQSYE